MDAPVDQQRRKQFERQELIELLISLDGLLFFLVHQSSFWLYGKMSPIESVVVRLGSNDILYDAGTFLNALVVSGMTSSRKLYEFYGIRRGWKNDLTDTIPVDKSNNFLLERHYGVQGLKRKVLRRVNVQYSSPTIVKGSLDQALTLEDAVISLLGAAVTEFIHATTTPYQYAIADSIIACVVVNEFTKRVIPSVNASIEVEATKVWSTKLLPDHGQRWLRQLEHDVAGALDSAYSGHEAIIDFRFIV